MEKLSELLNKFIKYCNKILTNINNNYLEVLVFIVIVVFKLMIFDATIKGFDGSLQSLFYMFIISTGTVLVLCSWTLLLHRKLRITMLIILDIICSLIILSDLYFFRYYNDFISIPTLAHSFLLGSVKSSLLEIINLKDVIYIFDILVFLIIVFVSVKFKHIKLKEKLPYRKRIMKFLGVLFAGLILVTIRINGLTDKDVYSWAFERFFFVSKMNILNYHAYDIYEYNVNKYKTNKPLEDQKKQEVKTWFEENNSSKSIKNTLTGVAKGKNLIMIQVEALQQFVINKQVNGQEITPNINRLINRSLYFDNYYFQTGQGNTSDAEFVSNTSLYPIEEGAVYFKYPSNKFKSIGTSFKEKGYSTAAFHGYKSGFWNRGVIYPNLGYDMFYSMERLKIDEIVGLGISDKSMFNQSIDILKNMQKPYFSMMVTLSSHHPFDKLKDYQGIDVGEYKDTFLGNYFKSINYTDAQIGEFISRLEQEGMLDDTVVVLYGDHFAIDKDHKEELTKFLGVDLSSEVEWFKQQKVPMLIHFPKDTYKGTISTLGGQVDLFPTLSNLFGLNKDNLLGSDLLDITQNSVILRNGTITDGTIYYSPFTNKVFDMNTGEEEDLNLYKDYLDKIKKKILMSDLVISKNLVNFLEGKEEQPENINKLQ